MRARRLVAAFVELIVAIIMSFLFAQVAARLISVADPMAYTIGTIGAYALGIMVGVYFSAEILDEAITTLSFQDAVVEYLTSISILGPVLAVFAFNIGPKSYGTKL